MRIAQLFPSVWNGERPREREGNIHGAEKRNIDEGKISSMLELLSLPCLCNISCTQIMEKNEEAGGEAKQANRQMRNQNR